MTEETTEAQELSPEQMEAQAEADFEEGFGATSTETVAINQEAEEHSEEPETISEESQEMADPEVRLSRSQLDELLGKSRQVDELSEKLGKLHDVTHGTLGSYKDKLSKIEELVGTMNGGKLNTSSLTFKRLSEYEPELAEMLAQDLQDNYQTGGNTSSFSIEDYDAQITEREKKRDLEVEKKLLIIQHPDVLDILKSNEWNQWVGIQDDLTKDTVSKSNDSVKLGRIVRDYKTWRDSMNKTQETKQSRLENAVMPNEGGISRSRSDESDEEAFLAGFRNA